MWHLEHWQLVFRNASSSSCTAEMWSPVADYVVTLLSSMQDITVLGPYCRTALLTEVDDGKHYEKFSFSTNYFAKLDIAIVFREPVSYSDTEASIRPLVHPSVSLLTL